MMPPEEVHPNEDRNTYALSAFMLSVGSFCGCIMNPLFTVPFALVAIGLGAYSLNSGRRTLAALAIGIGLLYFFFLIFLLLISLAANSNV